MFESVLEKILLNNFGQFITGLDKNNLHLGVWSGNVVIENVNLKPDVIDMLEIPIKLKFSTIGRLQLQVPWSKLSSSPVEITLEKILIIVSPKSKGEWEFKDLNTVKRKWSILQSYAKSCIEKFIENQKKDLKKDEDKKGQSFIDKLSMKVIDNLQLTIKNIHFRFEDEKKGIYKIFIPPC